MSNQTKSNIKELASELVKSEPVEQDEWKDKPAKSKFIKSRINQQVKQFLYFSKNETIPAPLMKLRKLQSLHSHPIGNL